MHTLQSSLDITIIKDFTIYSIFNKTLSRSLGREIKKKLLLQEQKYSLKKNSKFFSKYFISDKNYWRTNTKDEKILIQVKLE